MIFEWVANSEGWLVWNSNNPELKPVFKIDGDTLIKINPKKLNSVWKAKMEMVLDIWIPPGFEFVDGGYKMRFIDGFDLHGNKVFSYDNSLDACSFDIKYTASISSIFDIVKEIDERLGMTFADISPSNIVIDTESEEAHLIDFDDIIPIDADQQTVWNHNYNKIFFNK